MEYISAVVQNSKHYAAKKKHKIDQAKNLGSGVGVSIAYNMR